MECPEALPSAPGGRFGVRVYDELATGEGYEAEAAMNAAFTAAAEAAAAAALSGEPFWDSGERGEAMLAGVGTKSFAFPAGAEEKVKSGQRECPNNTCRLYTHAWRCGADGSHSEATAAQTIRVWVTHRA